MAAARIDDYTAERCSSVVPGGLAHVLGTHLRASSSGQEGRRSFDSTNTTLTRGRRHQAISLRAKFRRSLCSCLALQPVIVEELAASRASIHAPRQQRDAAYLESGLLTSSPGPSHSRCTRIRRASLQRAVYSRYRLRRHTLKVRPGQSRSCPVLRTHHRRLSMMWGWAFRPRVLRTHRSSLSLRCRPARPSCMTHECGTAAAPTAQIAIALYYLALMMPSSLPPAGAYDRTFGRGCFELGPEGIRVAKQTSTKATRRCIKTLPGDMSTLVLPSVVTATRSWLTTRSRGPINRPTRAERRA